MQFIMTLRFSTILTIITCLTTALNTSGQTSSANTVDLTFDTSNTVIIKNMFSLDNPFDSTFKEATLIQSELQTVDSILKACVTDYNKSLDKERKRYSINMHKRKYVKQLVVVTNQNGEKEVWVNCLCYTGGHIGNLWRTRIISVDDGGSCFFNFKINLATKKHYDLIVNGEP